MFGYPAFFVLRVPDFECSRVHSSGRIGDGKHLPHFPLLCSEQTSALALKIENRPFQLGITANAAAIARLIVPEDVL